MFLWDTMHAERTLSDHLRVQQTSWMCLKRIASSSAFARVILLCMRLYLHDVCNQAILI